MLWIKAGKPTNLYFIIPALGLICYLLLNVSKLTKSCTEQQKMEPQTPLEHRVASVPEGRWGISATNPPKSEPTTLMHGLLFKPRFVSPCSHLSVNAEWDFFLPWVSEGAFVPSVGVQERGSSRELWLSTQPTTPSISEVGDIHRSKCSLDFQSPKNGSMSCSRW